MKSPLSLTTGAFCRSAVIAALLVSLAGARAAIPPVERSLPDDTLALVTIPDFAKLRDTYKNSAERQLWNDPAMKPFKDKFMSHWTDDLVKPLERELNIRFDDYTALLQGQVTFALIQNGWQGEDDDSLGVLLLVDAKEKAPQLKSNLADLRRKWADAGKPVKTEKIRDLEFSVLTLSSNDIPKTLREFFPKSEEEDAADSEKPANKPKLIIGQFESLLILSSNLKTAEKAVGRLAGGSIPPLAEQSIYQGNHQAYFRDANAYGWVNLKTFIDIFTRKLTKKDADSEGAGPKPDKIFSALGVSGLKSIALSLHKSPDGDLIQAFLGVPESSRQGLFKILAGEAKPASPPAFVPADAVKFQRWRLDGQKAFAALERMLNDISPQFAGFLSMGLTGINTAAREQDPNFDVRKNLIGNLGDDLVSYQKAAKGSTLEDLKNPPSLFLIGSPNADQLTSAIKTLTRSLNQGGEPAEREFLGRKIYSTPLPNLPLPMAEGQRPSKPRKLHYTSSGGYVAMSTDNSILEEYLRSSESQGKSLKETAGLVDATQKVVGPGTSLFGYENVVETTRTAFEMLRKDPGALTNSTGFAELPGVPGVAGSHKNFMQWLDFSLLPNFDRVSKYFSFMVYGAGANVDGLQLKMFVPVPPQLKGK